MEQHKGRPCPLEQQFPYIWLSDARPIHEGVFAEAEEGHEDVKFVLVGCEEVGAEEVGNDKLVMDQQLEM